MADGGGFNAEERRATQMDVEKARLRVRIFP